MLKQTADDLTIGQKYLIEKIQAQADAAGLSGTALLRLQAAQMGVTGQTSGLIEKIEQATTAHNSHTFSMGSSMAKMESMRAVHDAMTGQYTRMGSALFVLGNATGASTALFSAAGAPLLAVVGGVALGAAALAAASIETRKFNQALQITGGYVGQTAGQLTLMAQEIGGTNHNIGMAIDVLTAFAGSGAVTSDVLRGMGQAATNFGALTGQSAKDVSKEFLKVSDDVAKFALDFDAHYHLIDNDVMQHIKKLQDEGEVRTAQNELFKEIAKQTQAGLDDVNSHLTGLAKGWHTVEAAAKSAWEQMKTSMSIDVGSAGPELKLKQFQEHKKTALGRMDNAVTAWYQGTDSDTYEQGLLSDVAYAKQAAAEKERLRRQESDANQADAGLESLKMRYDKSYRKKQEVQDLKNKFFNLSLSALGKTGARMTTDANGNPDFAGGEFDVLKAGIMAEPKGRAAPKIRATDTVEASGQIAAQQRAMALEKDHVKAMQSIDDLYHQHGLLADMDYYNQKRAHADEAYVLDVRAIAQQIQAEATIKPRDAAAGIAQQNKLAQLRDEITLKAQMYGEDLAHTALQEKILVPEREYAQLQKDAAAMKKNEADRVAIINEQVASGLKTRAEGDREILGIATNYSVRLEKILAQLRELSDANPALRTSKQSGTVEAGIASDIEKADAKKPGVDKSAWDTARESMQRYADEAQKDGADIGKYMTGAFKGAEDAFVQFTATGKMSFKSLAASILQDIERIMIRKAIAGLVNMALGSMGGGIGTGSTNAVDSSAFSQMDAIITPNRAGGGPFNKGNRFMVGENGPEMVTMGAAGFVTPNGGGTRDGAITIINNINATTGESKSSAQGDAPANMKAFAELMGAKVREVIMQEKRNGGMLT